jgi:hypothetical protein
MSIHKLDLLLLRNKENGGASESACAIRQTPLTPKSFTVNKTAQSRDGIKGLIIHSILGYAKS